MNDPVVQGLSREFSDPHKLSFWVKGAIAELGHSMQRDLQENRIFAYLSRMRQPEELYYRALYALFIAKENELPHLFSGDAPNSLSAIYEAVNREILDNRGALKTPQTGLRGEQFTAMRNLNDSAHVSFPFLLSAIGVARTPEYQKDFPKHLAHLNQYCAYLNYMEGAFAAGKTKADVLITAKVPQGAITYTLISQTRARGPRTSHRSFDATRPSFARLASPRIGILAERGSVPRRSCSRFRRA
jgi:hypothetical protein